VSRGALQRRHQIRSSHEREHRTSLQRVQSAAELKIQREHEEERGLATPEGQLHEQARAEGTVGEQPQVQQRTLAPAEEFALVRDERSDDHD
jgi:hypothetical protein